MTLSTECKSGHSSLKWGCKDCEQKLALFIDGIDVLRIMKKPT